MVMVCLVLVCGMDHIKNLKVKELNMLLCCYLGSETFKGSQNKLELVETVTELFMNYW